MKAVEDEDGRLALDGDVLQGAKDAFEQDRFVEAFDLVQAWIDYLMANLVTRYQTTVKEVNPFDIHFEEFRTKKMANDLVELGLIDPNLRSRIYSFYYLRNRVTHKMIFYTYRRYPSYSTTREEVEQGFKEGQDISETLYRTTLPGEWLNHDKASNVWVNEMIPTRGFLPDGSFAVLGKDNKYHRIDARRKPTKDTTASLP